ncbi:hypothetical protein HN587_06715 [Candidatus Woesearchaeota archaeon]|jgi:hypothetical protein|nr:hypothetical protein [Candidatus Woesearchaeota archaeon]
MIGKILGIGDLITAIVILLFHLEVFSYWRIGIIFVVYLIFKGVLFFPEINSILDILCGAYMLLLIFGFTTFLTWAIIIYLGQKAFFSLMS